MSQYGCIVPIDWTAMCSTILPFWLELIEGQESLEGFASRLGLERYAETEWLPFPPTYLSDIGCGRNDVPLRKQLPLETDRLRVSNAHRTAQSLGCAEAGTHVLTEATIVHVAVDLSGRDVFERNPWNGYYSRLHRPPHVQVAGTKNCFHCLEALFDVSDSRDATQEFPRSFYSHRRKSVVTHRLEDLLECLFLGFRTFPGVEILGAAGAWPASDDYWIAGYLLPEETKELATLLEQHDEWVDPDDELFPVFNDRVVRAASDGLALIAFHGFLF